MQERQTKVNILLPQSGLTRRLLNNLITFKATAADTNGIYALFEIDTPPGEGMPPHLQQYDDETFWVLQGTISFLVGDREWDLGAGAYAFVPRGTRHGFRNSGRTNARMLTFVTPGGIQERFYTEAGKPAAASQSALAPADPADLPRIVKIAQKYGIEMLLPPGA